MQRLGVLGSPKSTVEDLIKAKLGSNYVYNRAFSDEFNVGKFNMLPELEPIDGSDPVRCLAAFEDKVRLITMF
jgi:hypothetical protein